MTQPWAEAGDQRRAEGWIARVREMEIGVFNRSACLETAVDSAS